MLNKQAMEAPDSQARQVVRDATPLEHTPSAWGTRNPYHEGVPPGDGDAAAHRDGDGVSHGDAAEGHGFTTKTTRLRRQAHSALRSPRTWSSANTTGLNEAPQALQGPTNTSEGR